jgi:hypothetical protein
VILTAPFLAMASATPFIKKPRAGAGIRLCIAAWDVTSESIRDHLLV